MFDLKGFMAPVIIFIVVYMNQVWVWGQSQQKYLQRIKKTGFGKLVRLTLVLHKDYKTLYSSMWLKCVVFMEDKNSEN